MKRIPIVIIITALITGLILFFGTCNTNPLKEKPDKTEFLNAKKKLVSIDKNYNTAFDSLKLRSDSLEKELFVTQSKLKVAKMRLGQSEITLVTLAKKSTDSITVTQRLTDCDSLKAEALVYVDNVDSIRCMYETSISELQNLLGTKDSEIVICRSSYSELKNLMNENFLREQKLTDDLQTAYKSQRRKSLQNKLLAGGMLLLSGISTSLFINAHK